ncbi:hypothetical protein BX600DRAFT_474750 [Xylariales sp. PMI_506]|nr:hypothetical protein BX600DRAFT_474750 [Xylariales sp. PMI_506]
MRREANTNLTKLPNSGLAEVSNDNDPSVSQHIRGFLDLPAEIRIKIYRLCLLARYPLILFQDTGSERVECFSRVKRTQGFSLLRISQQVYKETAAVFYGAHHFVFWDSSGHQADLVRNFLACIGPRNACLLSCVSIAFPAIEDVQGESLGLVLGQDGFLTLKYLQEQCSGLQTLHALVDGPVSEDFDRNDINKQGRTQEWLDIVSAQLQIISSLRQVIIHFPARGPSSFTRQTMERLGWQVELRSPVH